MDTFCDLSDGNFDVSNSWLLERSGFLSVPILLTEPAVGFGAGMHYGIDVAKSEDDWALGTGL